MKAIHWKKLSGTIFSLAWTDQFELIKEIKLNHGLSLDHMVSEIDHSYKL